MAEKPAENRGFFICLSGKDDAETPNTWAFGRCLPIRLSLRFGEYLMPANAMQYRGFESPSSATKSAGSWPDLVSARSGLKTREKPLVSLAR